MKCNKCKAITKEVVHRHEGGQTYSFCALCTSILDKNGTGNIIPLFLQDRDMDEENYPIKMSFIEQSMLKARLDRAKGKSKWRDSAIAP